MKECECNESLSQLKVGDAWSNVANSSGGSDNDSVGKDASGEGSPGSKLGLGDAQSPLGLSVGVGQARVVLG